MEVHFCELNQNDSVAFFPESGRFFKTNEYGRKLIENIAIDARYENLPEDLQLTEREYNEYYNVIEQYGRREKIEKEHKKSIEKVLDRLVIHVSNDCNLRCTYCYARGGAYSSGRSIMTLDMVQNVLDRFYGYFDRIKTVQIFGGEPLYNMPAIKKICEYIRKHDEENDFETYIGLVTNATMINERFIKYVTKYNIMVTVSYDGDKKINDITRAYASGRGTSEDILEKTKRLYNATNQPSTIEVTYTQYHVENKVEIVDILRNLKKLFPKTAVHLVPVSGEKGEKFVLREYKKFGNSVDEIFDMQAGEERLTYSLLERIITGISNHAIGSRFICNAGVGTLSVSVWGDVYPCFMFTDERALKLGNIVDDNVFESHLYKERLEKMYQFNNKSLNPKCSKCFMRRLCNGCLGLNARHENDEFELNEDICDMYREMATKVIVQCVKRNIMTEVN